MSDVKNTYISAAAVRDSQLHPSHETLRAFLLGNVSDEDQHALERHILDCQVCCDVLRDVTLGDSTEVSHGSYGTPSRAEIAETTSSVMNHRVDESSAGVPQPHVQPIGENQVAIPQHIGRYQVHRFLGGGGFGRVYLAHDPQLNRYVAIKVPHLRHVSLPADIHNLLQEAQNVASLDHPHIVPVFDVVTTDDIPCFIVSKYIQGANLAQFVADRPPTQQQAAELTAMIADALHHAHLRGLVHRDIKPANILIDEQDKAYVADFGLALADQAFGTGPRYGGTPKYMSPEQAASKEWASRSWNRHSARQRLRRNIDTISRPRGPC
jgi:serine/threonine protein kinase